MLIPILLAASAGHVAVLEFVNEVPQLDRAAISQRVRDAIPKDVEVMTREQMFQLAAANPQALDKCDDRSCIDVGKLLGADSVVDGRIVQIGPNLRVELKLVDTRGGRTVATAVAAAKTKEELLPAVDKAVRQLFKQFARPPAS
jgi:TolB-like protein